MPSSNASTRDFWNDRYGSASYHYGTAPNDFLHSVAGRIPPGPVLCLAEGEGRNAVFLASRGHAVTAVDQSEVGLAKAAALARDRHVPLHPVAADLAGFAIAPRAWAGIVAIFMHLPAALRRQVLARAAAGLQPGGTLVLEAYTPAQLRYQTGGPRDPALLPSADELRAELAGLHCEILREIERDVHEGPGHTGRAAVVQVLAFAPSFP